MSAVLNDRDAILQAAATRIVNPKNADILLQQSAPAFHVSADGAADVASITVSATLVGLEGAVSWSVQGATLTSVTDREATVTYGNMQGSTAIVSASIMSSGERFAKSVVLATIQDGAPGSSAKTVKLTPSEQVFKISKTGTNSPASITLTATGQNTAGTPSFTIPVGTATLTAGSSSAQKVLTFANMTTDQVTVEVTLDGQKDRVTIYKVREGQDGQPGVDAVLGLLTNETVTLPASSNGTVSSFSGAACTMKMYQGVTDDSANWAYAFSPASASNRLVYTTNGGTVTVTGMAAGVDSAYVDITATKTGAAAVTKRFTVTKSKAGASITGARGAGQYYAVGSVWSDVAAQAACPGGPAVNDQVTISNGTVTYTKRWDGAAWNVPGAYLSGSLFVEGDINGSKLKAGTVQVTTPDGTPVVTIGGLQPGFEAPGTKNSEAIFSAVRVWEFRNTQEGWGGSRVGYTLGPDSITVTPNAADPTLMSPSSLAIDGSRYDKVRARIKRISGAPGVEWDGTLFYEAVGPNTHGFVSGYKRAIADATKVGEFVVLEWDMQNLAVGGTDWSNSTIGRLRIDLSNSATDSFEIDWIVVGKIGPATLGELGYTGDKDATKGAPAGTTVGGALAETVASNAAAGKSASDALPSINTSLAAKLDAAGNQNLSGPVALTANGAIVVGTVNDGVRISTGGLLGRKAGYTTFSIAPDGTAVFGGNLVAATGTLGSLTLAAGGNVRSANSGGWDVWPAAGAGNVMYLGAEGLMLGNYNNYRFLAAYANGDFKLPGFEHVGGQLTITQPILVNPRTQSTFSVSLAAMTLLSQGNGDLDFTRYATISNGSGSYEYDWAISAAEGTPMKLMSSPNASSASVRSSGYNVYNIAYLTLRLKDLASNLTATATAQLKVQHGTGQV